MVVGGVDKGATCNPLVPVVIVVVGGVVVIATVVIEIVDVVILVIVVAPALIFFCHWEVVSSQELSASRDGTCNDT